MVLFSVTPVLQAESTGIITDPVEYYDDVLDDGRGPSKLPVDTLWDEYDPNRSEDREPVYETEAEETTEKTGFVADYEDLGTKEENLVKSEAYELVKKYSNEPEAEDKVTFIVEMEKPSLVDRGFDRFEIYSQGASVQSYQREQITAIQALKNNISNRLSWDSDFKLGFEYKVAMTGLAVTAKYKNKAELERMPGVKSVFVAPEWKRPTPVPTNNVELLPSTVNATTMIGADQLNTNGFTGKGTRIAILDTGIVVDHPGFQPLPEDKLENPLTVEETEAVWEKLNASKTLLRKAGTYYNTKIPFRFNYDNLTYEVGHNYAKHDHGTHVAGISAANNVNEVVGVAPDAQLIVMQVFSSTGGASFATIMGALEDCILLGVDSANLSLGMPAGFTDDTADSKMNKVLGTFEDTGIQVLIASGNETNGVLHNKYGNMALKENPDTGIAGTPSTYKNALAVASVNNNSMNAAYFTVDGRDIAFTDTSTKGNTNFFEKLKGKEFDYVIVPGIGEEKDYADIDVKGKIAVVLRGGSTFPEKQGIARDHGAVACIIRNNEPGGFGMVISEEPGDIPCVSINYDDGKYLVDQGGGKLKVSVDVKKFKTEKILSSFSSWGATPDLKLKPEISGVGGNIYSTVDPNYTGQGSQYGLMSGTSMATPQVAGAAAIMNEYFKRTYPEIKGKELRQMVANIMMSTANILKFGENEVSPRGQGSGLVDLVKATTTKAYLTSKDVVENRPKGEMGDNPAKDGVFKFNFEINNFSDEELTYNLDLNAYTNLLVANKFIKETPVKLNPSYSFNGAESAGQLKYDFDGNGKITTKDARYLLLHVKGQKVLDSEYLDVNKDGKVDVKDVQDMLNALAEINGSIDLEEKADGEKAVVSKVTVKPHSKEEISVEIRLSAKDKEYLNQFPNGNFVDGFLHAKSENGNVDLNMPFLGFYGDWSAAPIFDHPDMEIAQAHGRQIVNAKGVAIGVNPYIATAKAGNEYNAISYSTPLGAIIFGQVRGAKKLEFSVENKETGEVYWTNHGNYIRKSVWNPMARIFVPTVLENGPQGEKEIWDGTDKNGNQLPSGTKVKLKVVGYVDEKDDTPDDKFEYDLTIDSQFPKVNNEENLQKSLRFENDRIYLKLNVEDDQHIAAILFIDNKGKVMTKRAVDNTPGVPMDVEFDITGFGNEFNIVVADYALNEKEIEVELDLGEANNAKPKPVGLEKGRLYGCQTFDRAVLEPGWFSVKKADFSEGRNETFDPANRYYAAEFVNGYVIAMNAKTGSVEIITPGGSYWPSNEILTQGKLGSAGFKVFYDMALQYNGADKTDRMFAVGWHYKGDSNGDGKDDGHNALFELKLYENGQADIVEVGKITGVEGEILTLGISEEGKAYGINTKGYLYEINLEPKSAKEITTKEIGETDFTKKQGFGGVNVIQSMGYDHNDKVMYWYANSQSEVGNKYVSTGMTYKVDLKTAKCTEVGSYGQGGETSLFVPHDKVSDFLKMDVEPTYFNLNPNKMIIVEGQKARIRANFMPWNAKQVEVKWESENKNIATVDKYGFVTGVKTGNTKIKATAKFANGNETTEIAEIEVVKSEDGLYAFIVADQRLKNPIFKWHHFSDKNPRKVNELKTQQEIVVENMKGEKSTQRPLWQGGAYYQGYVYSTVKDAFTKDGVMHVGSTIYKYKVNKAADPKDLTFGDMEKVGFVEGRELGNMAFDYNTGRMYVVDLKMGGLGLIDLEDGSYDYLGNFSGDIGGPVIAPSMTVTRQGTVLVSDMRGRIFKVDPDTMETKTLHQEGQDYWFYGAMHYDYNTDSIYWNPVMGANKSPLKIIRISDEDKDYGPTLNVMELPSIMSRAGSQSTIIFSVPEVEPETKTIPVEKIEITNAKPLKGIVGGKLQLETKTTPLRPTNRKRTWESSDPETVHVDKYGELTFIKEGKAKITVSISNKGDNAGTFTDKIEVEVIPSSGKMEAFIAYEDGGSHYYDFWLEFEDHSVGRARTTTTAINLYSIRNGFYYDGFYYGYTNGKKLLKISENDKHDYTSIGHVHGEELVNITMDYATGTSYAVTKSNKFGTLDINTAEFKEIGQLDKKIQAIAVGKDSKIYGVGSEEYNVKPEGNAKLYEIKVEENELSVEELADMPFGVYSEGDDYTPAYCPQMVYDFKYDRLYINATSWLGYSLTQYSGMYIIDTTDENYEAANIGGIMLELRGNPKKGKLYLGMLALKDNKPVATSKTVDGIFLNKSFGRIELGKETELKATLRPSTLTNEEVEWITDNEDVATVDNGVVKGLEEGTANITVTLKSNPDIKATAKITVAKAEHPIVAYSALVNTKEIKKFNLEFPGDEEQIEFQSPYTDKIKDMIMIDGRIYYLAIEGNSNNLYSYDPNVGKGHLVASLNAFFELDTLAYDKKNDLLYASAGFYLFQYEMEKIRKAGGQEVLYAGNFHNTDNLTVTAVSVVDGDVYFVGKSYATIPTTVLKKIDLNFSNAEIVKEDVGIETVPGKTDMEYSKRLGKFFITDAAKNIYLMDVDGTIEGYDVLGNNLKFAGIAFED